MGFQADLGVPVIRVQLGRSPAAFLQQASGCFGCPCSKVSVESRTSFPLS